MTTKGQIILFFFLLIFIVPTTFYIIYKIVKYAIVEIKSYVKARKNYGT